MNHYDVFLSHANSDKLGFVEDLKKAFDKLGIDIFYDKDVLKWGDKWKEKIYEGLKNCDVAVIVISDSFYGREWTEKELHTLLSRDAANDNVTVLPLLYKTTAKEVFEHYRTLSDIQFLDSAGKDVKDITICLAQVLLNKYHGTRESESETAANNYDAIFDACCADGTLAFYKWLQKLIDNDNQFIENYDDTYIGWEFFKYNGDTMTIFQNDENQRYRINPKYYQAFIAYFDKNIKNQI